MVPDGAGSAPRPGGTRAVQLDGLTVISVKAERDPFDDIAARLRDDDLEFVLRTERLSQKGAPRKKLLVALLGLWVGALGLVLALVLRQPVIGAIGYLVMVFTVSPAVGEIFARKGDRLLRRFSSR
jgi:hypothetical protein